LAGPTSTAALEHQPIEVRPAHGEVEEGAAHRMEARTSVAGAGQRRLIVGDQRLHAAGGDGGQQGVAVGEVAIGRAVRDAQRQGQLAHRQPRPAAGLDHGQGGGDQGFGEVAVVVGGFGHGHMLTPTT